MPATINEITTQAGNTLKIDQWVRMPGTKQDEYARIKAFTLGRTQAGPQPDIRVHVHRFVPYTCSHPCIATLGGPEEYDPDDLEPATPQPEPGWCEARGDYAYFDMAKQPGKDR